MVLFLFSDGFVWRFLFPGFLFNWFIKLQLSRTVSIEHDWVFENVKFVSTFIRYCILKRLNLISFGWMHWYVRFTNTTNWLLFYDITWIFAIHNSKQICNIFPIFTNMTHVSKQLLKKLFHTFFRFIFAPIGVSLGIKNTRPKRAANIPALEDAYSGLSKLRHKRVSIFFLIHIFIVTLVFARPWAFSANRDSQIQ